MFSEVIKHKLTSFIDSQLGDFDKFVSALYIPPVDRSTNTHCLFVTLIALRVGMVNLDPGGQNEGSRTLGILRENPLLFCVGEETELVHHAE